MAKLVELKKIEIKNPYIIIGFTGTGLVGSISGTYIADNLNMEMIAIIEGKKIPAIAPIHNYIPLPPVRVYYSKQDNVVLFVSEAVLSQTVSKEIADLILLFAKKTEAKAIINLAGLESSEGKGIKVISSNRELIKDIVEKGLAEEIKEGATAGISSILLSKGKLYGINTITILSEANEEYGDPVAAIKAIKVLANTIKLKIDTRKLEQEAKEFSELMKGNVIKSKELNYEESMYG